MSRSKNEEQHPSWGMVSFARVTYVGDSHRLFGSPLEQHGASILLRVQHACREHSLGQDHYYATSGLPLIEIELTAAQFAALLTTMNVGDGVPCTIRWVNGKQMPPAPDDQPETERVRDHFREDAQGITTKLAGLLAKADVMLSRDLKAKDRKELRADLDSIVQDIKENLPFVLKQFDRATERITNAAKAEVDATLAQVAARLGMERLRELGGLPGREPAKESKELSSGSDGKEQGK